MRACHSYAWAAGPTSDEYGKKPCLCEYESIEDDSEARDGEAGTVTYTLNITADTGLIHHRFCRCGVLTSAMRVGREFFDLAVILGKPRGDRSRSRALDAPDPKGTWKLPSLTGQRLKKLHGIVGSPGPR